jgi:pimeloyl-ACP methyl ester carboxylesterase
VVTEPDAGAGERPCLVVLNSGWIHRSGPGRLGVEIARRAAEAGFAALRFDFSGIGDSAARVPPHDAIACGIADAKAAMDHLAASGMKRFVLVGLCSGARHAHYIATADERVVGAVLLDGYSFPTLRSNATKLRERFEDPIAVLLSARRLIARLISGRTVTMPMVVPREEDGAAFFPRDPTRAEMARHLALLARRRVGLLCVYSGEWRTYSYEGQLKDAFPELPLASLLVERIFPTADHLYFTQPERAQLLSTVIGWLRDRFG